VCKLFFSLGETFFSEREKLKFGFVCAAHSVVEGETLELESRYKCATFHVSFIRFAGVTASLRPFRFRVLVHFLLGSARRFAHTFTSHS
jgi:hypothetical protein